MPDKETNQEVTTNDGKAESKKRAVAVIVIGIVLAFAIYYGELTIRTQKENAQQLKVPARGLEYYRPVEDRTSDITRIEHLLSQGTGTWEDVVALVDAYDASKTLRAGADFFHAHAKKHQTEPLFIFGAGLIYLRIHAFAEADKAFSKALELNPNWIPALKGLANARLYLKELNQAKVVIDKALILAQNENHRLLGDILGNLATLQLMQNNLKEALDNQMAAITLHEQSRDLRAMAIDYLNLAKIKLALGIVAEAKQMIQKSIDLAQEAHDKLLELQSYGLMVIVCQQGRDEANAQIYLAKGKKLAAELGIPEQLIPQ